MWIVLLLSTYKWPAYRYSWHFCVLCFEYVLCVWSCVFFGVFLVSFLGCILCAFFGVFLVSFLGCILCAFCMRFMRNFACVSCAIWFFPHVLFNAGLAGSHLRGLPNYGIAGTQLNAGVTGNQLLGLENFGNTCYLNSIVQSLVANTSLSKFFTEDAYRELCALDSEAHSVTGAYANLVKSLYLQQNVLPYVSFF